jgi:hypothetical protein
MEACYRGTDVMERSCAVARGIDINNGLLLICSRACWGAIRASDQQKDLAASSE